MGKKILRSLLIALLITGIAVILIGCSFALPNFDPSKLNIDYKTTTVYDRNDKEIMSFQAVPGEPVKLNQIPKLLQDALVDVEDSRFYKHNGIDFKAIGRAVVRDVLTLSKAEGGSTLTQQLAKNVYLTHDQTFSRKINEIYLAAQIERNYSKEDILEMYFNRIYFGAGATGIKMAAATFFDKGDNMQDLTLGEMALLAGLPNAPTALNPWIEENQPAAIERRNVVLEAMYANGHITQEQLEAAKKEKINLKRGNTKNGMDQIKYPYYLDYILEEAENQLNIPAEQILRGGVQVYTNLDTTMQQTLEDLYKNPKNFPQNAADGTWAQSASVVVDPSTGGILAMVGGRDKEEHVFRGLNRISNSKLLPGSSLKPIVDYAPALDTGFITANSSLKNRLDKPFPGGYNPRNWNGKYTDTISVQEALSQSLNVPAASLLYDMGIDKGYEYATNNFGIPMDEEYKNRLGIALGAVEVRMLDLAGAYTAFANDGVRTNPHAINKIVGASGNVIGEIKTENNKAIKPETARTMTKLLMGAVNNGTGSAARVPGRQVAGKTGTIEFDPNSSQGNRTATFAGYTPGYLMVTWMGFDNTDANHYLKQGSEIPAALFSKTMSAALKGVPAKSFDLSVSDQPKEDKETKKEDQNKGIVKDLSASLNGKKGVISWSPVDMEGIKYYLYRAEKMSDGTAANSVRLAEQSKPGYTDTHLEEGKTYLYNVVVAKDGKDVSMSNFAQLTVPGAAKPAEPEQPETPNDGGVQPGTGQQPTGPSTPNTGQPTNPGGTVPAPTTPTPTTPDPNDNTNSQPNTGSPTPGGGTPPAQPGTIPSTPVQ